MAQISYKQADGSFGVLYDVNLTKEDKTPLVDKLNELGISSAMSDDPAIMASNIDTSVTEVYDAVVEKETTPKSKSLKDIIAAIKSLVISKPVSITASYYAENRYNAAVGASYKHCGMRLYVNGTLVRDTQFSTINTAVGVPTGSVSYTYNG